MLRLYFLFISNFGSYIWAATFVVSCWLVGPKVGMFCKTGNCAHVVLTNEIRGFVGSMLSGTVGNLSLKS